MLRRARVPMPPAAAAATPRRGVPKGKEAAAAGGLGVLSRAAADVILYGFLAAFWAYYAVGTVVEILGRWICGRGSSVEAAGIAVGACCKFIIVLLFPSYYPLVMMRVRENAIFDLKEEEKERREKLPSNNTIAANELLPKRDTAVPHHRLPKGVKLAPFYAFLPIWTLQILAIVGQHRHEEQSLMWRVAGVLFDVTWLGYAVIIGVWGVRNLVILVRAPKAKDGDDEMQ